MTNHHELAAAYLDRLEACGVPIDELTAPARSSDLLQASYRGRYLARPVFLDHAEWLRVSEDLVNLRSALTSLPRRLFGGDLAAFARAVGMAPAQVTAVVRGTAGPPTRLARADLYRDDTGFRLLEINITSALGGLDSSELSRALLRHPVLAGFVAEHRLAYLDVVGGLVDTLRAECGIPDGVRPLVAIADWPASFVDLEPQLWHSAGLLSRFNLEAVPCHVGQLSAHDGRVWLDGRPVDVVYRLFMVEDLLDLTGPALLEPILGAAERGEVALFTPMDAELYGSKGALALLSDEAHRHLYGAAELASLDRILPWTRMVRPGPVTVDGERVDLLEYALDRRTELILKPTLLHGGIGVVPGWLAEPQDWATQVKSALDGPYLLQRRIRPAPELFPGQDGPAQPWYLNWGLFLMANGYGGGQIKGLADADAGVVSIGTGAAFTTVFHQPRPD
jgi:hypothetical protein